MSHLENNFIELYRDARRKYLASNNMNDMNDMNYMNDNSHNDNIYRDKYREAKRQYLALKNNNNPSTKDSDDNMYRDKYLELKRQYIASKNMNNNSDDKYRDMYRDIKKKYLESKNKMMGGKMTGGEILVDESQIKLRYPSPDDFIKKLELDIGIMDKYKKYTQLLNLLDNFCNQPKVYENIVLQNLYYKIYHFINDCCAKKYNFKKFFEIENVNMEEYKKYFCEFSSKTLIPEIILERKLYTSLLTVLVKSMKLDDKYISKEKIDEYIKFVMNTDLINELKNNSDETNICIGFVEKVVYNYPRYVYFYQNNKDKKLYDKNVSESKAILLSIRKLKEKINGDRSISGKQCISGCTFTNKSGKNACTCDTKPYKTGLFGKRDWDYCDASYCRIHDIV